MASLEVSRDWAENEPKDDCCMMYSFPLLAVLPPRPTTMSLGSLATLEPRYFFMSPMARAEM